MALVYEGPVCQASLPKLVPEGASDLYVPMERRYLDVYSIQDGDALQATIEFISERRHGEDQPELEGTRGRLIVANNGTRLFIDEALFSDLRDWGFVEEGFWVRFTMDEATASDTEVELFANTEKIYEG